MKTWHEYYRDKNKVEVLIKYTFSIPSRVDNFNIDKHPIHIRQKDGEIHVNYHKEISQTLLDDIKAFFKCFVDGVDVPQELLQKNPSQYIVGFIGETLATINKEITDRKYQEGHLILRTISLFDIRDVFVVEKSGGTHGILWPKTLPGFLEVQNFPKNSNVIFIRDLADAMSEYFYFNFDECIRKIITSLENYFLYYNLSAPPKKQNFILKILNSLKMVRDIKFKRQVNKYITDDYYNCYEDDLKILRENILFVYEIRSCIVHDKLRIRLDNVMFCKKAIGTLLHIYQSTFTIKDGKKDFIFLSFDMQFNMIDNMIVRMNLDNFERAEKNSTKSKAKKESMFSSLKITEKEKTEAKKGYKL